MNLSIIIPNFNGGKLLSKNLPKVLESIEDYNLGSVEIVITDDRSTDESIEVISIFVQANKNSSIDIRILTSNKNKNQGFSANVNRGVSEAKGDIIFLLNTDVNPHKDFWQAVIKHFDNPKVFAVGCLEESLESGQRILRGRGIGRWHKGFLVHSAGELTKTDTLWVSGGSGAFRKSIWDKLGGLDNLYNPFYWEDIDMSYRAIKSGYLTQFESKSIVEHEHDEGTIKTSYKSSNIKKTAYRNQFIFVWKNSDVANLLENILWLPYHLITSLISGDLLLVQGFFAALILLPKIIRSRLRVQKQFILRDPEVTRLQ